ncbi:MAG: DUF4097 family beta strand repeat protein [Clostridia bacterium]|nr:DUF4097 family beta strand repeat protein [Clostridia bacterium]MBR5364961.1 DUF4097 family beta strand repeat protein [Clostridia bacterium]
MKKALCLLAVLFIIAGGVLLFATFPTVLAERAEDKLKYYTITQNLALHYDRVEVHAINADVTVTNAADEEEPAVVTKTDPVFAVTVTEEDGHLVVRESDQRKWYQKIGIFSPKPGKIEVRLADAVYPELILDTKNGDLNVEAPPRTVSFETIGTETVNGDTNIHIAVDFVVAKSVNGDLIFTIGHGSDPITSLGQTAAVFGMTTNGNIIDVSTATHKSLTSGSGKIHTSGAFTGMAKLYVKTTNGDIELDRIYGQDIQVETVNGDVTASLWKPMNCQATSLHGDIHVPAETGEYPFTVSTTNGDITVTLAD